ncbi:hypothetical protein CH267_15850 [Rhodococcus sp. 06-621-2]|nr:hypothetical protein [Rhodococcus sp. 06-621-2]OZC53677.1 hypothetical protein CH267_15850 [Rhodococcus sp. 06-621-2]
MRRTVLMSLAALCVVVVTGCSTQSEATTSDSDAPAVSSADGYYGTTREATADLAEHTVYRPSDLSAFEEASLPVLAWANGGCKNSTLSLASFLGGVASQGYIVIANGGLNELPVDTPAGTTDAQPDKLIDAIDWVSESEAATQQLDGRADTSKIGVFGTSCGGVEALVAGSDPRVKSIIGLNTGLFPEKRFGYERTVLNDITVPTLIFNGGPTDVAYQNSIDSYQLLKSPAVLVSNSAAGHSGLTYGWREGEGSDGQLMIDGYTMAGDWFDYTLNGDSAAKDRFVGPDCGICTTEGWEVDNSKTTA